MAVQTYILRSERDRQFALRAVYQAKIGQQVRISRPTRTAQQNKLLHAVLTDLADQLPWPKDSGELHDVEWWKRRVTLGWLRENRENAEIVTDLEVDGEFGILLPHTSDLSTEQSASLTEWVFAFGATNGVEFREPPQEAPAPDAKPDDYEGYR